MTGVQMAYTFHKSASALTMNERGRLLDLVGKLQQDPSLPGMSLERVSRAPDPHVWSVRVSQALRAILWREGSLSLLLYAGHHDDAYSWAARHRVGSDGQSGALQLVTLPVAVAAPSGVARGAPAVLANSGAGAPAGAPQANTLAPFAGYDDAALLGYGVPPEWVTRVRAAASVEAFTDEVGPDLPPEVADRLFALALGLPAPAYTTAKDDQDGQEDAEGDDVPPVGQQFYPVSDLEELNRLLSHPLAQWLAFLHPDQRRLVDRHFSGPVKVTGSAGTGKTVLALHRARALARRGKRVLLTSYTNALCDTLERQLDMLCTAGERGRIRVMTVHALAAQLSRAAGLRLTVMADGEAPRAVGHTWYPGLPLSPAALVAEWQAVMAPHGVSSWEAYRAVSRAGRGRPLSVAQRKQVWDALAPVLDRWRREGRADFATLCERARVAIERDRAVVARAIAGGVDAVIVDEVQDLGRAELRLLAAVAGDGQDRLFLTGDGGQRIYGGRLSLASCGIAVRGRSFILRVNYRTTAQIRRFADRVLPGESDDLDDGREDRRAVRSVLSGAHPVARACATPDAEAEAIAHEILTCAASGYALEDIAVFTRTNARAEELRQFLLRRKILAHDLDPGRRRPSQGTAATSERSAVTVTTLHRAKGMEYKAVIVAGASRNALPFPAIPQEGLDPADQADARSRESHLLYVGLTRARDRLLVTWTGDPSEHLEGPLTAPEGATLSAR